MNDDPLTHFGPSGDARMVDVEAKPETPRMASARARVRMDSATLDRIRAGDVGKGDVLQVARLAGISGAKAASGLIPLCHPVRITAVEVDFELDAALPGVHIRALVRAVDRTGPEMEALAAAGVAALTVYDMCKAMDRGMTVETIELVEKSGGKSGDWRRSAD